MWYQRGPIATFYLTGFHNHVYAINDSLSMANSSLDWNLWSLLAGPHKCLSLSFLVEGSSALRSKLNLLNGSTHAHKKRKRDCIKKQYVFDAEHLIKILYSFGFEDSILADLLKINKLSAGLCV